MRKSVVLLLAACLPAAAAVAAPLVIEQDAPQAHLSSQLREQSAELRARAAAQDASGLLLALQQIEVDPALSRIERTHLIDAAILAMSVVTPDAAIRQSVSTYLGRDAEVLVRMSEEHPDIVVPLYDLSATAAFTLRRWDENLAQKIVTRQLLSGHWSPSQFAVAEAGIADASWRRGTEYAFESIDDVELLSARDQILVAQSARMPLGRIALIAANRLHDRGLYAAVVQHAEHRTAIAALRPAADSLPGDEALDVLAIARGRSDIASAAVLELGSLAVSEPLAYQTLFDLLGDADLGGAAALVLARTESAQTLADLRDVVIDGASQLRSLRAILALRLSGSDAAMALLQDLRQSPAIDDVLRGALP